MGTSVVNYRPEQSAVGELLKGAGTFTQLAFMSPHVFMGAAKFAGRVGGGFLAGLARGAGLTGAVERAGGAASTALRGLRTMRPMASGLSEAELRIAAERASSTSSSFLHRAGGGIKRTVDRLNRIQKALGYVPGLAIGAVGSTAVPLVATGLWGIAGTTATTAMALPRLAWGAGAVATWQGGALSYGLAGAAAIHNSELLRPETYTPTGMSPDHAGATGDLVFVLHRNR